MRSIVGTPLYMSPQILNKQSYTNKSDLWSIGLIFYEMVYGQTPWPANNEVQLLNNIMTRPIPFNTKISDQSKDFIKRCLKIKEEERMSWEEAFSHPLMDESLSLRLTLQDRFVRSRYEEKENRLNFRSKTKSAKKRSNISRSPLNKTPLKTPKICKNRTMTPDKKSPWKI